MDLCCIVWKPRRKIKQILLDYFGFFSLLFFTYFCNIRYMKILYNTSMKVITILLLSIFLNQIAPFQTPKLNIINPLTISQFATSLKYQQRIGSCIQSTQLTTLNKVINQASVIYKSDYQQNLKYIKQNMDDEYGTKNTSYIVFILNNSTKTNNNYYQHFYNLEACNYVLLAKGVNKINTNWSYLIFKIIQKSYYTLSYVHNVTKGEGIDSNLEAIIKNVVLAAQGKQTKCNCLSITISSNLQKFDNQYWNTICMPANDIYGYILSKNQQWMITNPKHCFYLIFAKQ